MVEFARRHHVSLVPEIEMAEHADYMLWPRAAALAEVTWSQPEKDYADFSDRLRVHRARLDVLSVHYRPLD